MSLSHLMSVMMKSGKDSSRISHKWANAGGANGQFELGHELELFVHIIYIK